MLQWKAMKGTTSCISTELHHTDQNLLTTISIIVENQPPACLQVIRVLIVLTWTVFILSPYQLLLALSWKKLQPQGKFLACIISLYTTLKVSIGCSSQQFCFSGSTPQASYADIARMASAVSPPQGQVCGALQSPGSQTSNQSDLSQSKWPSVGQTRPSAPLWTANVTLHPTIATPLPPSQEEGDQCYSAPVPPVPSSLNSSTKRDAMTNTVSAPESEATDCSSVGNLLSDLSYPPLSDCGKPPVTQCVQTFISQASRTSPAISPGVTMANCVDVEDSAKRAASPAAFDSVRENTRTSTLDRPAVIILDEAETETPANGDPELTFGFEINEMLLSGDCSVSSEDEAEAKTKPSVSMKVQPSLTSVANINLDKIVAFVGRGECPFVVKHELAYFIVVLSFNVIFF